MKVNEFMIGNFVFHERYGNAIIETIDNDFGDNPSVKVISENIKHKDGYKYGYCWCDLDEIFPIPLTPEILEKNGIVYDYDQEECVADYTYIKVKGYQYHEENVLIDYYNGHIKLINDITNTVVDMDINYVHELQNALKLCGIEKIIEP